MANGELSPEPIPDSSRFFNIEQWLAAERVRLLRRVLPWLGGTLSLVVVGVGAALLFHPDLWQLWTMAGTTAGGIAAFGLAVWWSRQNRVRPAVFLILAAMTGLAVAAGLLFDDLLTIYGIVALLIALLATFLVSPRAGFWTSSLLVTMGLVMAGGCLTTIYSPPLHVAYDDRLWINTVAFVLTLSFGVFFVALSRQSTHRALEQLGRRSGELAAIVETGRAFSSSLDLEELLLLIARRMSEALGVAGCTLSRLDREADAVVTWLEWRQDSAEYGDEPGTTYPLAEFPATRAVLESRQPLTVQVSDPAADPAEVAHMRKVEDSSLLMLPLVAGDEVIGLVELDESKGERRFAEAEIDLAQALASHAAEAIRNARLYHEVQRSLRDQVALREAGLVISSTLDLQTVLSRIVEQMGQAIDATSAYLCDYDPQTNQSTVRAEYIGPEASAAEQVSDLGHTYSEVEAGFLERMRTGRHDCSHREDPDLTEAERAHMEQYGAWSILYFPLRVRERLLGFAELWESRRRRVFTPREVELTKGLAQQAAMALENARLYDQARREIAERRQLAETLERERQAFRLIAEAAIYAADVSDLCRRVLAGLVETLGFDLGTVRLYVADSGLLHPVAFVGLSEAEARQKLLPQPLDDEQHVAALVARTAQPVFAPDVARHPIGESHGARLEEMDGRACIGWPLLSAPGELLGVILLTASTPREIPEEYRIFFETVAGLFSTALERKQAEEALREQEWFVELLNDITGAALESPDLQSLLQLLADRLGELFGANGCYLTLWDEENQAPIPRAACGEARDSYRSVRAEPGEATLTASVLRAGRPLAIEDAYDTPYLSRRIVEMFPGRSLLALPLQAGNRKLGAAIVSYEEPRQFTPADLVRGEQVASQLSLAVAKVQLLEEVQARNRELEEALAQVKQLRSLLPICSSCKKIRDDDGYWQEVDQYLLEHADILFSHGLCPDCAARLYPKYYRKK